MSEACPLNTGEHAHPIPETCMKQCEEIYSDWRQTEGSNCFEIYGDNPANCSTHEVSDLDHSSADIFAGDATTREYIVVDKCADCGIEYRETSVKFTCPYAT